MIYSDFEFGSKKGVRVGAALSYEKTAWSIVIRIRQCQTDSVEFPIRYIMTRE